MNKRKRVAIAKHRRKAKKLAEKKHAAVKAPAATGRAAAAASS